MDRRGRRNWSHDTGHVRIEPHDRTPLDDAMDDIRRELILRVARADRDVHREIYDARENEWVSCVQRFLIHGLPVSSSTEPTSRFPSGIRTVSNHVTEMDIRR